MPLPLDRFAYDLPPELIAQTPADRRDQARLLDVQGGELERFGPRGIHFARRGDDEPQLFRWSVLVGMAIRGGVAAEAPGDWMLISSEGDRIRGEQLGDAAHWLAASLGCRANRSACPP